MMIARLSLVGGSERDLGRIRLIYRSSARSRLLRLALLLVLLLLLLLLPLLRLLPLRLLPGSGRLRSERHTHGPPKLALDELAFLFVGALI